MVRDLQAQIIRDRRSAAYYRRLNPDLHDIDNPESEACYELRAAEYKEYLEELGEG